MRKNNRKTAKLRMKIGICIAIIIAVLIVKKFDGHEKNKIRRCSSGILRQRLFRGRRGVRHVQGNRKKRKRFRISSAARIKTIREEKSEIYPVLSDDLSVFFSA